MWVRIPKSQGDNQKQTDALCGAPLAVDVTNVNSLHLVQSAAVLAERLDLFDRGAAKKLV